MSEHVPPTRSAILEDPSPRDDACDPFVLEPCCDCCVGPISIIGFEERTGGSDHVHSDVGDAPPAFYEGLPIPLSESDVRLVPFRNTPQLVERVARREMSSSFEVSLHPPVRIKCPQHLHSDRRVCRHDGHETRMADGDDIRGSPAVVATLAVASALICRPVRVT